MAKSTASAENIAQKVPSATTAVKAPAVFMSSPHPCRSGLIPPISPRGCKISPAGNHFLQCVRTVSETLQYWSECSPTFNSLGNVNLRIALGMTWSDGATSLCHTVATHSFFATQSIQAQILANVPRGPGSPDPLLPPKKFASSFCVTATKRFMGTCLHVQFRSVFEGLGLRLS